MIDLNGLIQETFGTIEQVIPDAIVHGKLVKYDKVYNRDTAKYENTISDYQDVKCVFDSIEDLYRTSENSDSIVSKIHVFGYLSKSVDLFDEMILTLSEGEVSYKTDKLRKINVGESAALHTFVITR